MTHYINWLYSLLHSSSFIHVLNPYLRHVFSWRARMKYPSFKLPPGKSKGSNVHLGDNHHTNYTHRQSQPPLPHIVATALFVSNVFHSAAMCCQGSMGAGSCWLPSPEAPLQPAELLQPLWLPWPAGLETRAETVTTVTTVTWWQLSNETKLDRKMELFIFITVW